MKVTKARTFLAAAIAALGLATPLLSVLWLLLKDRPVWLAALFLLCAGLLMPVLFLDAYLADYEAGRWKQAKDSRNLFSADVAEEALLSFGLVSLFAGLVLSFRFDLSYGLAILSGLGMGFLVMTVLALLHWLWDRFMVFIVQQFFGSGET